MQESKLEELSRNLEAKVEEKTKEIREKNKKIHELLDKTVKGIVYSLVQMIAKSEELFLSKSMRLRDMSKKIGEAMFPDNVWELEIASLLSHLGCLNLDADLKIRYFSGEILTQAENIRIREHIMDSATLLEKIPMFEPISLGINNMFYNSENINSDISSNTISIVSRTLRIVHDYDNLILTGKDKETALSQLKNNSRLYDYSIYKAFEDIIVNNQDDDEVQKAAIRVKDIKIGMRLADEVTDLQGNVLITRNEEITQNNIALLTRLHRKNQIVEPIYIIKSEIT